eukprot:CAMPEP_0168338730 /NCGR_PEP_ID=MMETSP0213-20121227/13026_1 /TAXON_ID=151035 /ORGANISM="Euplotes harpa, Strain FSP1.4" /LENGTH=136 /DNA_ID=CAMNT_0008344599 /DNA_START=485 /DNA_END=891 /DNA_ORIENTATION=+
MEKAIVIIQDINELNNDISKELLQQREKLLEANKQVESAVKESNEALEEVKEGAKSSWSWFSLKLTSLLGFGGAGAGLVVGSVPGAVIGGAAGGIAGGVVSGSIQNSANDDIDRIEGEHASKFDKEFFDKLESKRP